MTKKLGLGCLLWVAMWLSCPAWAANPYDVVLTVPDTSPEARQAAAREALNTLVAKQTGLRDPASVGGVAALLADASPWLQQYNYLPGAGDGADPRVHLIFDGVALERALAKAGVTTWGRRPALLALTQLVAPGEGPRILGGEDSEALRSAVSEAASRRGVHVIFPLLDLEDQALLSEATFSDPQDASALALAQRYGCDLVWAGRVVLDQGQWGGSWRLAGDMNGQWRARSADPEAAVRDGIDAAIDRWVVARQDSRKPSSSGGVKAVTLWVRDVRSLDDYWRVAERLQGVPGITGVVVSVLASERVGFTARTALSPTALAPLLAAQGYFDLDALPDDLAANPSAVGLRLRP